MIHPGSVFFADCQSRVKLNCVAPCAGGDCLRSMRCFKGVRGSLSLLGSSPKMPGSPAQLRPCPPASARSDPSDVSKSSKGVPMLLAAINPRAFGAVFPVVLGVIVLV